MSSRGGGFAWVLAAVLASGCSGPERDPAGYREESAVTLSSAQGSLATTRLALRALLDEHMFTTSADDTITTAEVALDGLVSSYRALQPPRRRRRPEPDGRRARRRPGRRHGGPHRHPPR